MSSNANPLRFVKLDDKAIEPRKSTEGAAAFDLFAIQHAEVVAGFPVELRTGLSFEVPAGFAMLVCSRSGHGFNHDVRLSNSVGVVDSDYRGEVKVKLTADGRKSLRVQPGDKIAQFMLVPVLPVALIEAAQLSSTARAAGGFGSTGA